MFKEIRIDLQDYITNTIIPQYEGFDGAHDLEHVRRVINKSITLAKCIGVDCEMAYVIAAYHDIGMQVSRKDHSVYSACILKRDTELQKWFSEEQRIIMAYAVEDHSTSAEQEPRSLYGKIIYHADKSFDAEHIIKRSILYGMAYFENYKFEQHAERVFQYINKKYGEDGQVRLWLEIPEESIQLENLRNLIKDKKYVYNICQKYYGKDNLA